MNPKTNLHERLLIEAQRIGDQLIREVETDPDGSFWQTMRMGDGTTVSFAKSESIYAGVSGIVLFLLELYKKTGTSSYLETAKKVLLWAVAFCENNPAHFNAFYTGSMGVPYALLRMAEVTEEKVYLDKALGLAYARKDSFANSHGDDLLSGRAGVVLGLLHLFAATGETWLLEAMDSSIQSLLARVNHGPVGLYWDRSAQNISGLCGLAHGATGVGFVFLELGHYFNNETFYRVAEQAFLYERYFYFQAQLEKNWPDLRKGLFLSNDLQEHRSAFLTGNLEFFTRGHDMNAWCHGAMGIGLSRLRACQLLTHPIYQEEARFAIDKTIKTTITAPLPAPTFTLCHGSGGNAELFLYAYQTFKQPEYLAWAEIVATRALEHHEKMNHYLSGYRGEGQLEDRSLFMGNAGIGYFLLRVLDPFEVPSILLPEVKSTYHSSLSLARYPFISIETSDLLRQVLQKDFQRTLRVCEELKLNDAMADALNFEVSLDVSLNVSITRAFIAFMEHVLETQPSIAGEKLAEVFSLEKEKRQMDEAIKSFAYESIKEKVLLEQAEELMQKPDGEFLKLRLVMDAGVKLFASHWNWSLENHEHHENLEMPEDEYWFVLLKTGPMGIVELELTSFSYTILYEFQEMVSVEQVIQTTIGAFEALTAAEEEIVKGDSLLQIKQALLAGLLVPEKVV